MQTPINSFKRAIAEHHPQIAQWLGLGLTDHYTAEICAGAGFDWVLIAGEHSPSKTY
ncbi:2-keto-3-deoxy-L-rhamnonate aldolase RhmA [Variovorax paradoxus]|uniref:2-keto-3-deoxy-L-rhamnonate aldolase RhmA n=1 Tax=Variovorax paradoxus TaxID=34073 RepID=A0AAW8E801_VARPD|nr:2-keto-3-deoxy-L-rhamnonate aldolase RhmA [Variovorax paradoxus]